MAYELTSVDIYLPKNKVIWDNSYKNIIRFTSDEKISTRLDLRLFRTNYNFVFNNFIKPNQIILSIQEGDDFNAIELANLKLIAVKAYFVSETRWFYYFVDNVIQENGKKYRFSLILDIMTTFKINKDFRIDGIFTERLHFDRYQKNSSGDIICSPNIYDLQTSNDIDSGVDSADYIYNIIESNLYSKTADVTAGNNLVTDEDIEESIPKGYILIYVQDKDSLFKCRIHNTTKEQDIERFIYNPLETGTVDSWDYRGNYILAPYTIYVVPFSDKRINAVFNNINTGTTTISVGYGLQDILKRLETQSKKILDIKFTSYLPTDLSIKAWPLYAEYFIDEVESITDENLLSPQIRTKTLIATNIAEEALQSVFILRNIYKDYSFVEESISIYDQIKESGLFEIPTTATKSIFRQSKYEVQMLKKPYFRIEIKSPYSEGYDFSLFDAIISNLDFSVKFRRECSVVLETAKEINYFVNDREGTGLFGNVKYKVGDVANPVYNLTWDYDSLAEYLQNNKNALITSALTPFVSSGVGAVSAFATTKNPALTAFTSAAGLLGGIVNSAINIDNIKNRPNSIKIGSNALMSDFVNYDSILPKIYIKALRRDKREIVFDWVYRYGYSWNRASNSVDWFNRYIFNYVKTLDSVHAHIVGLSADVYINEQIENEIQRILNDGVTFWEEDSGHIYNWNYENFEKAILED